MRPWWLVVSTVIPTMLMSAGGLYLAREITWRQAEIERLNWELQSECTETTSLAACRAICPDNYDWTLTVGSTTQAGRCSCVGGTVQQ